MKKVSLFGAFFLMAMVMFTSCLGESSNSSTGTVIGVIRFDLKTFKNVLDISEVESLYSVAFSDMNEGDCYSVYYELDMDLPANHSDSLKKYNYYTVKIMDKNAINKYRMFDHLTDTTQLLTNEIVVTNPIYGNSSAYIKGKFFVNHELMEPTDQKTLWDFSYDPNNMVTEDGNYRIYDVFIRATNSGTQSAKKIFATNAYDMESYLKQVANAEKNLKNDKFYLRFNYVSEIKDNVMVWSASEKHEGSVVAILPAESK